MKPLKTKGKENILNVVREELSLPLRKNDLNDSGFVIKNHGNQKKVAQHFSSDDRKELSIGILYPQDTPFRNEKEIKKIL